MKSVLCLAVLAPAVALAAGCAGPARTQAAPRETVRVAVIGGMVETGFWAALAERFQEAAGYHVEVVASGQKHAIAEAFRRGEADLITMHASDTIINLVADGYATDPQPWLKNDLVIVGPPDDPARVRGLTDAGEALRRIRESGCTFVVHSSLGAQDVLRDVLDSAGVSLDPEKMVLLFTDKARQVLQIAAEKKAYTLVGRIPFLSGKLPNDGLVLMVRGDPQLRRPYVVAVADPARFPSAHVEAAKRLARFLKSEETQQWIADYGRGQLDDQPLFIRLHDAPAAVYGKGSKQLVVATGSPGELGLLKALSEEFARENDARVLWREAGSGESLQLLRDGQADVAMTHVASAEKTAVAEGWAARRTLVGSNEFYIVGPADDPARVRAAKSAAEAYGRIAACRAKFLSRADESGTHKKEMAIWQKAGVAPQGDWYVRTHDFMTATLLRANAENAYFMTDSSTWVVAGSRTPNLTLLFRGDPFMVNVYHALCRPEGATPGAALAARFVDFLASEKGQKIVRDYGKDPYGEALYRDARYARQFE